MNEVQLRVAEFRYWWWERPRGRLLRWFVWRLPRSVVYWCAIRIWAASTNEAEDLPILTVLKRWEATS